MDATNDSDTVQIRLEDNEQKEAINLIADVEHFSESNNSPLLLYTNLSPDQLSTLKEELRQGNKLSPPALSAFFKIAKTVI